MWNGYHFTTRPDEYINATIDSAGLAQGFIGPCPEGFCWYVERTTCYSNDTATTGILEVYSIRSEIKPSDTSKQGRQDVAVGAVVLNGVSDEASPIYIGPGYFVVASWSGLTAGKVVAMSMQIRVHKLETGHEQHAHGAHPLHDHVGDEKAERIYPVIVGDQVAEV
jgi:hypothetical protein